MRGLRYTWLLVPLLAESFLSPPSQLCAQAGRESAATSPALPPRSTDLADRVTLALVRRGFANVAAVVDGPRVFVAFENTRFRDERRALREAAGLVLPELGEGRELVLVPTNRAVPLVAVRYAGDGPPAPAGVSLDVSTLPPALRSAPRAGSSFGRIDVVVHPWFEAVFGDYGNPVASRTGVAPEIRVALGPGLGLSAQALVTLQDDLSTGESRVRPAVVALNRTVRLPRDVFVSATAGTFNPDRYGVDVEARAYLRNGRWSVGAQTGLTGAASYAADGWGFAPMRDPTALADLAWRSARHDLLLRATAGVFLGDERGVRLDVVRQFGELEVGWFVVRSPEGANGGAALRIPLLPARYAAPGPVRVRPAEAFRWQYRYQGFVPSARRYQTGHSLEDFHRRLNPDYVANGGS